MGEEFSISDAEQIVMEAIWKRGGGAASEIIADLERTFGVTGLSEDVTAFVSMALEKRWLELRT